MSDADDRTHECETEHVDDGFAVLSNRYRRRLLLALLDREQIRTDELAGVVGDADAEASSLQLGLIHAHLPKLQRTRFVEWDRASGTVRRGERFAALTPMLRLLSGLR